MTYAWIPAAICVGLIVTSLPVYEGSPAISSGLAGASNLPMSGFVFFAGYEALREDREMGGGPGGRDILLQTLPSRVS